MRNHGTKRKTGWLPVGPRTDNPSSVDEVLDWLSEGRLTPAEAFSLFRQLDVHSTHERGSRHHRSLFGPGGSRSAHHKSGDGAANAPHTDGNDGPAGSAADAGDEARLQRQQRMQAVLDELDRLIGLQSVKELVREVQAFVEIQRRRARENLAAEAVTLHMVFKGNPGTGKTTVARILGRLLAAMDALPKGHMVECERADLVGEYIGHTAQRTREQIRKAMGGILFIDEAYSLARGGEKDFGKEAIDTLVKAMEDHKNEFVVILAGYRDEMEYFLMTNPGLRSRFPIHIEFPDYTTDELLQIAHHLCAERQYRLSPAAARRLLRVLEKNEHGNPHFGNARFVRNVIERAIRRQALRLVSRRHLTRDDLMTLEASDVWEAAIG